MKLFGMQIGRRHGSESIVAEEKSLTAADLRLELTGGTPSKAGVRVNWKQALRVSTALACARVIAEGLAQVPFRLYREDGQNKVVASEHPLHTLLSEKPNDWQTSYELREQIALHLVFCGGAYIWLNTVRGKIVELLPYEPGAVTVKREGWDLRYHVTADDGTSREIPAAEMWHLRGPSWNGWMGLDCVDLAREVLGLAIATEEHGARLFSNGARLGGILTTDSDLKPDARKALRESWELTHGGNANAFKTGILWGGLKWQSTGMPSDQAQLIEQRRFQVEEICRAFRVMPIMVGYSDKTATYASAEQMFLAHVVHTLGPWYARVEQSANARLLTERERSAGHYFKFMPQALMRGAHKDRAEYFAKALGAGGSPAWMTQDEVRALDELNPMGGNAGRLREPTNVGSKAPAASDKTPEADNGSS